MIRKPERPPFSREADGASNRSTRGRWALLALAGFLIVPSVYVSAVLTPLGQRVEDAALKGVRSTDLFGSDTALDVISIPVILVLVAVIVGAGLLRRRLAVGLGAGVVVLASSATSTLIKAIAARPHIADSMTVNSFPSGHVTIALAAVFGVFMVAPRRFRAFVLVIGGAYTVFVAAQTVLYGWHRLSDIVGACAVVIFWVGLVNAVGPRIDRGDRSDRDLSRRVRRAVTWILIGLTAAALVSAVVVATVAVFDAGHGVNRPLLIAGRTAAAAAVLGAILAVWVTDRVGLPRQERAEDAPGRAVPEATHRDSTAQETWTAR